MQDFHVRISKDELTFSAAHFITLAAEKCERLHGHNYRVAAEVHGPLDEDHYVIDFIALRDTLRAILDEVYPLEQTEIAIFYDETCLLRPPRIHIKP